MKTIRKAIAAAVAAVTAFSVWAMPVYAVRRYDAQADTYKAFSALTQNVPANASLIVKTNGVLPDLRAAHPTHTIRGPENTYIAVFDSEDEAEDALPDLMKLPGVEYAEVNCRVYAQTEKAQKSTNAAAYHSWGVEYIHADVLCEQLAGTTDSERVTVAVVDSGITPSHPVFADHNIDGASMLSLPYDVDKRGHGTAVAGVIAECTRGLPVDLLAVRILDNYGSGSAANAAAGIRYAADQGADIMNLSFVSEGHSQTIEDAVIYAADQGCLPVISAGNYGKNMDVSPICPSHKETGIVVSGCDKNGDLYSKTCFGSTVDLCAPAVNLSCADIDGGYSTVTGTSFASPHAAAAAALFKLLLPSADCAALERLLKMNLRDLGDPGYDIYFGLGVPDLHDVRLPSFTLTLDAGEGAFPQGAQTQKQYRVGEAVSSPAEPVREGYTFIGYLPALPQIMPWADLRCTALWLPEGAQGQTELARQDPTCIDPGYVTYYIPGHEPEVVTLYVDAAGHLYGEWYISRPASQYIEGEEKCVCVRCGAAQTRPIDKLPLQPLTLTPNSLRIRYRTSAFVTASEPVEWSVDDNDIVHISGTGAVTTVARGQTVIRAHSIEGDKYASCSVEVYYDWWQWIIVILLGGWLWY